MGGGGGGDVLGWASGDEFATLLSSAWAHVDNPVSVFNDFEIMLDHNHRITPINQAMQNVYQMPHIFVMETNCRLV